MAGEAETVAAGGSGSGMFYNRAAEQQHDHSQGQTTHQALVPLMPCCMPSTEVAGSQLTATICNESINTTRAYHQLSIYRNKQCCFAESCTPRPCPRCIIVVECSKHQARCYCTWWLGCPALPTWLSDPVSKISALHASTSNSGKMAKHQATYPPNSHRCQAQRFLIHRPARLAD
jgi:hypothetical protein